jgi:RNA recognition motif-containing protein
MKRGAEEGQGGTYEKKAKTVPDQVPSRSIYLTNFDNNTTSYYDIVNIANLYGRLEQVKVIAHKACAFLNFFDEADALNCYNAHQQSPVVLEGRELKMGWAKAPPLRDDVVTAVAEGASRNLFVGSLPEGVTEQALAQAFQPFGDYESIVIIHAKNIGFVNMLSVRSATTAKTALDGQVIFQGTRPVKVNYAKEPTGEARLSAPKPAFVGQPSNRQQQQAYGGMQQQGQAPQSNRAIYIGNLQPDVSLHDICKMGNRFGAIDWCKIVREKNCAFINFVDPNSAAAMHMNQSMVEINGNSVRVNWAKAPPLAGDLMAHVQAGATRNLWVGNLQVGTPVEELGALVEEFGLVDNIYQPDGKNFAFINLCSLRQAIRAKDKLNGLEFKGQQLRVNYAKEEITPMRGQGQFVQQQQQPQQQQQQYNPYGQQPAFGQQRQQQQGFQQQAPQQVAAQPYNPYGQMSAPSPVAAQPQQQFQQPQQFQPQAQQFQQPAQAQQFQQYGAAPQQQYGQR